MFHRIKTVQCNLHAVIPLVSYKEYLPAGLNKNLSNEADEAHFFMSKM